MNTDFKRIFLLLSLSVYLNIFGNAVDLTCTNTPYYAYQSLGRTQQNIIGNIPILGKGYDHIQGDPVNYSQLNVFDFGYRNQVFEVLYYSVPISDAVCSSQNLSAPPIEIANHNCVDYEKSADNFELIEILKEVDLYNLLLSHYVSTTADPTNRFLRSSEQVNKVFSVFRTEMAKGNQMIVEKVSIVTHQISFSNICSSALRLQFQKDIFLLPQTITDATSLKKYDELIQKYGTTIIQGGDFGGIAFQISYAARDEAIVNRGLKAFSSDQNVIYFGGNADSAQIKSLQTSGYSVWRSSIKETPQAIQLTTLRLDQVLITQFFKETQFDDGLAAKKSNLNSRLSDYATADFAVLFTDGLVDYFKFNEVVSHPFDETLLMADMIFLFPKISETANNFYLSLDDDRVERQYNFRDSINFYMPIFLMPFPPTPVTKFGIYNLLTEEQYFQISTIDQAGKENDCKKWGEDSRYPGEEGIQCSNVNGINKFKIYSPAIQPWISL